VKASLTAPLEWSTCSWLLFVELAKKQAELEASQSKQRPSLPPVDISADVEKENTLVSSPHAQENVTDPSRDTEADIRGRDVPNPHLTWAEVRQVMTRPDFVNELDHLNIIHIDRHHRIRADSMPLLRAFRKVAESEGFEDRLAEVMDRVSAIESLGRTREVRLRLFRTTSLRMLILHPFSSYGKSRVMAAASLSGMTAKVASWKLGHCWAVTSDLAERAKTMMTRIESYYRVHHDAFFMQMKLVCLFPRSPEVQKEFHARQSKSRQPLPFVRPSSA
jgi:hypothetical protein